MDSTAETQEKQPLTPREEELLNIWRDSFPLSQGDPDLQELMLEFVIKSGAVKPDEFAQLVEKHRAEFIEAVRPPGQNHLVVEGDLEVAGEGTITPLTRFFREQAPLIQPGFMSIPNIDLAVGEEHLEYSDSKEAFAAAIGKDMVRREDFLLFNRENPGRVNRAPGSDPFMSIIREQILNPKPRFPINPAYTEMVNALRDFFIDVSQPAGTVDLEKYPLDYWRDVRADLRVHAHNWEAKHPGQQYFPEPSNPGE